MVPYPDILTEPLGDIDHVAHPADLPSSFQERLVAIRRHLHQYPEVGNREHETSRFIRETLDQLGLEVMGPVAGTGLYVDVEGDHAGARVGYRADIDALPTQDAKHVAYASRHAGVAHLCGHDAHTAVGIGVAALLNGMRELIHGTIRVFFQPNEEGMPGGAPHMIRDGILEGLEAVYCIHVDPTLEAGRFGLITGAATAAADQFDVEVQAGRTGHSARPHKTTDTIWVAVQIANALYQIVGRITDPRNAAVLTICTFEGGEAFNVIPARVAFGGTLRTTERVDRRRLLQQIHRTAESVARLYDTDVGVHVEEGAPPVRNDGRLITHVEHTLHDLFDDDAIYHIPRPSMGGEDFSHYLDHVPGALIRVGTSSGPETSFPLHDACFDIDERALAPTAFTMARVLIDHLRRRPLG